jgi:hypothetical protein
VERQGSESASDRRRAEPMRTAHRGEELSLSRERDVHRTLAKLLAVATPDDVPGGDDGRGLDVALVESSTVGADK